MDVTIWTSDEDAVNADEVKAALEEAGYFVGTVTVNPR